MRRTTLYRERATRLPVVIFVVAVGAVLSFGLLALSAYIDAVHPDAQRSVSATPPISASFFRERPVR